MNKNFLLKVVSAANPVVPVMHSVVARDYSEACNIVWRKLCQENPHLNVWMAVSSWCWTHARKGAAIDPTTLGEVAFSPLTGEITTIIPKEEVFIH